MKPKFSFALVATLTIIFSSCSHYGPDDPSVTYEETFRRVFDYFPYKKDVPLLFEADENPKQITLIPMVSVDSDRLSAAVEHQSALYESPKEWLVGFSETFTTDSTKTDESRIFCNIFTTETDTMCMEWVAVLEFDTISYHSMLRTFVPSNQLFSIMKDTITLPFERYEERGYQRPKSGPTPDGAYLHIVKYQGLTEFSLDGTTFWRRTDVTSK